MSQTVAVIDTSTILSDSRVLKTFKRLPLVIPFLVLDELRAHTKGGPRASREAKEFFALFAQMRECGDVGTAMGFPLVVWSGSVKSVTDVSGAYSDKLSDRAVIAAALELKKRGEKPIILTNDSILLMMADAFNLEAQAYSPEKFRVEDLYPGCKTIFCEKDDVQLLKSRKSISLEGDFHPNEYLQLQFDAENFAYGRYDSKVGEIVPLSIGAGEIPRWISPRNREQIFALDALLNDDIKLVSLIGKAGTGKTLLALAAGLYKSIDCDIYERVLVSRPTLPMGQDIGFLPGSIEEKLGPWMHPIADNIDFMLKKKRSGRPNMRSFADLAEMDLVVIEPLAYIRGRSIHDQFLIVDEAQNLSVHEIRTILTRAGEGTKIILAGDPYQIDNQELTSRSSGLVQAVERFRDQEISAHITLTAGERSSLSELAADLL